MGLFHQFIEVIEWKDSNTDRMVYEFPVHKNEIKMGAQLTVRESQVAIFVNEGQIADVFEPGRYELQTENMPILTKLKSWKYGFNSPFKAEVYFVNTKRFLDQRWGTKNPVMMRDKEFGMIRLRGFGIYSFRIADPVTFMKEVFGTNPDVSTETVTPQLSKVIIGSLTDYIAEMQIPALDLAMKYDEIAEGMVEKMTPKFKALGLAITDFSVENLSLPPEVEAAMDKRTQMGVLGDMNKYTQYQTAEAIREAARNEGGGMAGIGAGLGAGQAIAGAMMNAMNAQQTSSQAQPAAGVPAGNPCSNCGVSVPPNAKFCPSCGNKVVQGGRFCVDCGSKVSAGAKFCPECGKPQ